MGVFSRLMGTQAAAPAGRTEPTLRTVNRPVRPRALHNVGFQTTAYDAAGWDMPETEQWNAWLASPDIENNFARNQVVARIRDLVRNDGWASGGITRITDSVIGAQFRLVANPDYRLLATFDPAFDKVWASEFRSAAEALWRDWANDVGRWSDAGRRYTVSQLFRMAFRQKLVDGEALALLLWLPERLGTGRASYNTALQLIDSDRLSNPHLAIDTHHRRAGVEIDAWGAPIAYHIRRAHMGDWFSAPDSVTWDRVPRETTFGRRIVIHDFESDRPGEHRPVGGVLKSVLGKMKMLSRYDRVELEAAVINAIFAAYIESPNDPATVAEAMGLQADGQENWNGYQDARSGYHRNRDLKMNGARIPTLFPGEKIVSVDAKRPATNFAAFENAALRNMASAIGCSFEQLSGDYSKTNYSSARAAMVEAWKTLDRRRHDFATGFATPVYSAFLEEAFDLGQLPLPRNAPDFAEVRTAYSCAKWMGQPRGWVDPVKEAQAAVLRMDAGLATLQQECADQGLDYEEVIAQRADEVRAFKENGLNPPVWYGDVPAANTETKPEPQ